MLNDKFDSESVQLILVHLEDTFNHIQKNGKSEVELTFLLNMIPIKCLVKISLLL